MNTVFLRRLGSLAVGMGALLLVPPGAQGQIPCSYDVTIIQGPWCGEIFGFPPTTGRGITEDGAVVGHYTSCGIGPGEAFYWSESTGFVTLERPAGTVAAGAWDVDENGQIAGTLTYQKDLPGGGKIQWNHAALWLGWWADPIDLGTLPGGNFSQAFAVSAGRVVGKWGNTVTGPIHGFIWQDGVMTDLGPDLGTPSSRANDIKNGKVVGWMGTAPQIDAHAFIWDSTTGGVTDLGTFPSGLISIARAIDSTGTRVVGGGTLIDPRTGDLLAHAAIWSGGEMLDIDSLSGFASTSGLDVNDAGVTIGLAWESGTDQTGFIYADGVIADLNELIPADGALEITTPWAINQEGQITGQGHNQDGNVVAFVLTPIEPPLGDLSGDCHVGILDLLSLLADWGISDSPADLNNDGIVNVLDLLILFGNWG